MNQQIIWGLEVHTKLKGDYQEARNITGKINMIVLFQVNICSPELAKSYCRWIFLKLSGSWAKVLFVRLWNVNWLKMLTVCKFLPFQILVKICECQLQFLWTHFKFSTQQILPLILQLNTLYCVVICLCLLLLNLFAAIHHLLRFPLSQLQFRKLARVTMSWLLLHHSTVIHGLTIIVH